MIKNNNVTRTVRGGLIASLYVVLTLIVAPVGFGPIQLRPSEALTVLPLYFPEAVPALFVGCIISNTVSAYGVLDILFGSVATLIAAFLTSKMKSKYTAPLPSVIVNALIVGATLSYVMTAEANESFWVLYATNFLSVGASQACVCYALGVPLAAAVEKHIEKQKNKK